MDGTGFKYYPSSNPLFYCFTTLFYPFSKVPQTGVDIFDGVDFFLTFLNIFRRSKFVIRCRKMLTNVKTCPKMSKYLKLLKNEKKYKKKSKKV